MWIQIDTSSGEAIYLQLRNQIILGIASAELREGDTLPPVRQMAGEIGINMHTVNKAYTLLQEEGFLAIDRHRGTVVAMEIDKNKALEELRRGLKNTLAKAVCRNVTSGEIHGLVDEILQTFEPG